MATLQEILNLPSIPPELRHIAAREGAPRNVQIVAGYLKDNGQPETALDLLQGENCYQAVRLALELRKPERAIECYESWGDNLAAAEIALKAGMRERALTNYEKAAQSFAKDMSDIAVDCLERAAIIADELNMPEKIQALKEEVANIFEEQGNYLKAANLCRDLGLESRALRLYEKKIEYTRWYIQHKENEQKQFHAYLDDKGCGRINDKINQWRRDCQAGAKPTSGPDILFDLAKGFLFSYLKNLSNQYYTCQGMRNFDSLELVMALKLFPIPPPPKEITRNVQTPYNSDGTLYRCPFSIVRDMVLPSWRFHIDGGRDCTARSLLPYVFPKH